MSYFIKNHPIDCLVFEGDRYLLSPWFWLFKPACKKLPTIKYSKDCDKNIPLPAEENHPKQLRRLISNYTNCQVGDLALITKVYMHSDGIIGSDKPVVDYMLWHLEGPDGSFIIRARVFSFIMFRLGRNIEKDYRYIVYKERLLFIYLEDCLCAIVILTDNGDGTGKN